MEPVYLDYAATTPVRPEVREAMAPLMDGVFGNPSSQHRWGRAASAALENARAEAAEALGARPAEICFVRGGTEADNLAIRGGCRALAANGAEVSLAVSAIEHHAVLHAAEHFCGDGGARLTVFAVSRDGRVDLDRIRDVAAAGPTLISCMWVNNETGIVLPLAEVAEIAEDTGATLHSDAVQAVGKLPVRPRELPGLDLMTISGHKLYGPKGTGLLWMRLGVDVEPLLHGGGQERALRPGTEDVAGAVGLATALRLATEERDAEAPRLRALRDRLEQHVLAALDGVTMVGAEACRAPHVSNLGFDGVDPTMLLINLDLEGVAASGASACQSGSGRGSHVIEALYGPDSIGTRAHVRFSLGRGTDENQIDRTARATCEIVRRLRGSA